jgi:hypothetical protein
VCMNLKINMAMIRNANWELACQESWKMIAGGDASTHLSKVTRLR